MLVGAVGFGACLLVIAVGAPVPVMVVGRLLAGVLNANVLVAYISLRTLLSPDALLGRVGATARTLSVGMMPIGSLATGILLDTIGGGTTLALMGVGLAVTGAAFALLPSACGLRDAGSAAGRRAGATLQPAQALTGARGWPARASRAPAARPGARPRSPAGPRRRAPRRSRAGSRRPRARRSGR